MAVDIQAYLEGLARKYGTTQDNFSSDIDHFNEKKEEDIPMYLKDLEAQYQRAGAHKTNTPDSSMVLAPSDLAKQGKSWSPSSGSGSSDVWAPPSGSSGSGSSSSGSFSGGGSAVFPDWYKEMMTRQQDFVESQAANQKSRADSLYARLEDRAGQPMDVNTDAVSIRQPTNAYRGWVERERRNSLADAAEAQGPYANIRGEERIGRERAGQAVGTFEANLITRELEAKRAEVQQALAMMTEIGSAEQIANLQNKLALYDQAIKESSLDLQGRSIGNTYDLGLRQIGLSDWDRQMYYDALNSGRLF